MKKLILFTLTILLCASVAIAQQRPSKVEKRSLKIQKEQQAQRAENNKKAISDARREAKRLYRLGWSAVPGALTLEKQMERSYMMIYDVDADNNQIYIFGDAASSDREYDKAKKQALSLAKLDLVGQVQSQIVEHISAMQYQRGVNAELAAQVIESVKSNRGAIANSITRAITVVEFFRKSSNGSVEVRVLVAYNTQMARKAAFDIVRTELSERAQPMLQAMEF